MDIDTYGRIAGRLHATEEGGQAAVFASEGVTRQAWEAAWPGIAERMGHDEAAGQAYASAFRAGLESAVGAVRDLTEDEYVLAEVARRLERPVDTHELSAAAFLVGQYRWSDQMVASGRVAARIEARVLLEAQKIAGNYEIRALPAPALATRVRQRRCPACAAPKHTVSRTPHVYCDFCGHLMDYDHEAGRVVLNGLDAAFVFVTLLEGVRPELQAAFGTDDAAWADAWRWVYRTDMALCPEGWTPRIRQADFREAMVEWSIETCRVANEPRMKAANAKVSRAWDEGRGANAGWVEVPEKKRRKAVRKHLEASDAALEVEIGLWEERGLFDAHPDGLTPDTYRRVQRGGLMDQWKAWLDDAQLEQVRAHVEASESWMEVPRVDLTRSACGNCGGVLGVVDGARALVCEGCGVRLDAERPRFRCPNCRADVVVVPDVHQITCGHCDVVFVPGGG